MPDYLKGNYKGKFKVNERAVSEDLTLEEQHEQEFYKKSLEKLGGSIAFVMKSKNMLWSGDEESKTNEPTGH
jgi:hypothetical protein